MSVIGVGDYYHWFTRSKFIADHILKGVRAGAVHCARQRIEEGCRSSEIGRADRYIVDHDFYIARAIGRRRKCQQPISEKGFKKGGSSNHLGWLAASGTMINGLALPRGSASHLIGARAKSHRRMLSRYCSPAC